MNEKFTDGCLDSNRAVRICCFKIWCMIDFLEVGQSINVTRKYIHLLGFWEFIGRRYGEIKSSETQMFMLAVMQTGSYTCQPASNGGFPDSKKASFGFLPRHGARLRFEHFWWIDRDATRSRDFVPFHSQRVFAQCFSGRVLDGDFHRKRVTLSRPFPGICHMNSNTAFE